MYKDQKFYKKIFKTKSRNFHIIKKSQNNDKIKNEIYFKNN